MHAGAPSGSPPPDYPPPPFECFGFEITANKIYLAVATILLFTHSVLGAFIYTGILYLCVQLFNWCCTDPNACRDALSFAGNILSLLLQSKRDDYPPPTRYVPPRQDQPDGSRIVPQPARHLLPGEHHMPQRDPELLASPDTDHARRVRFKVPPAGQHMPINNDLLGLPNNHDRRVPHPHERHHMVGDDDLLGAPRTAVCPRGGSHHPTDEGDGLLGLPSDHPPFFPHAKKVPTPGAKALASRMLGLPDGS